jgi:hypothetical protein
VAQLVEVLLYKPEGHNPFGRNTGLEPTQPLTDMSTTNISWGIKVAAAEG